VSTLFSQDAITAVRSGGEVVMSDQEPLLPVPSARGLLLLRAKPTGGQGLMQAVQTSWQYHGAVAAAAAAAAAPAAAAASIVTVAAVCLPLLQLLPRLVLLWQRRN